MTQQTHRAAGDRPHEQRYPDAATLMAALAADMAGGLGAALAQGREASLAVPGGSTPVPLFERLADAALDWSRVWVTLGDERWVPASDPASNEKLARDHLLQRRAAVARFVGLKNAAADAQAGAAASWAAQAVVPRPLDCLLLGLGEDGHTASLFPQAPGLAAALDPDAAPACVAMTAPTAPHGRISLNLAALLQARRIALLFVGDAKRAVYERALAGGDAQQMPVRALLRQQRVPVTVYWTG